MVTFDFFIIFSIIQLSFLLLALFLFRVTLASVTRTKMNTKLTMHALDWWNERARILCGALFNQ